MTHAKNEGVARPEDLPKPPTLCTFGPSVAGLLSSRHALRKAKKPARKIGGFLVDLMLLKSNRAPVAQLDRALGFEPRGWGFKSLRVRHLGSAFPPHMLRRRASIQKRSDCVRAGRQKSGRLKSSKKHLRNGELPSPAFNSGTIIWNFGFELIQIGDFDDIARMGSGVQDAGCKNTRDRTR